MYNQVYSMYSSDAQMAQKTAPPPVDSGNVSQAQMHMAPAQDNAVYAIERQANGSYSLRINGFTGAADAEMVIQQLQTAIQMEHSQSQSNSQAPPQPSGDAKHNPRPVITQALTPAYREKVRQLQETQQLMKMQAQQATVIQPAPAQTCPSCQHH